MNKLEKIRENQHPYLKAGFDAAIALDLPVKFGKFCFREVEPNLLNGQRFYITESIMFDSDEELYKYWIDNIYSPD